MSSRIGITFRAGWSPRYGAGDYLAGMRKGYTAHHTWRPTLPADATPAQEIATLRGIERTHVETNGWAAIGYHWAIFQSGHIYECRGWDRVGAHAPGANRDMYGIAFVINGDVEVPSAAAISAFRQLAEEGVRTERVPENYLLTGHRDHVPSTDCPGKLLYPLIPMLRHTREELPRPSVGVTSEIWEVPRVTQRMNLERIERPEAAHLTLLAEEGGRLDHLLSKAGQEAIAVVEVLGRRVLAAYVGEKVGPLKPFVDALADHLKERRSGH